ncbi:HET-domain-containing protein, partial [Pyrenochaeta sp. DS3sAY3a]
MALDHSKNQVRLVKFGKSRDQGFSQPWCDISTFDLGSAPPYYALSYTWGPQHPAHTILVNNGHKTIGNNLFKFCQEIFRDGFSLNKAIYFWIDQLCINQADILERNHQVKLMGTIYSEALMTVIWLHDEGQLKSPWELKCTKIVDEDELAFEHALSLTTYTRIVSHTYFSRLWIIQEILLARKV